MSKAKAHPEKIFVLCEDKANLNIATGFEVYLSVHLGARGKTLILEKNVFGGQKHDKVVESLKQLKIKMEYVGLSAHLVILADFDKKIESTRQFFEGCLDSAQFNDVLRRQVYLLGLLNEPEDSEIKMGGAKAREAFGKDIATACKDENVLFWDRLDIQHNKRTILGLSLIAREALFLT